MPGTFPARMALFLSLAAVLTAFPRPAAAQTCDEPHYRWTEKTDANLATITARRSTVWSMLHQWNPLEFTGQAIYECADRQGLEQRVYSVLGWVRRVKTDEADGDWHIEITSRRNSPVGECVVVEIPPPENSALYEIARDSLKELMAAGGATMDSHGDLSTPVRVRVIGAAFFDGEHRGGPNRRDQTDGSHGRCNTSVRALWEIHPVYWVIAP